MPHNDRRRFQKVFLYECNNIKKSLPVFKGKEMMLSRWQGKDSTSKSCGHDIGFFRIPVTV